MKRKRDKVRKISKAKKKTNVGNDHFEDQPYQPKHWDYIIHHDKWILNWRSKGHVTSSKLNENVFDLMRLEVNVVEPNDDEKEEAYMVGLIDKGRRVLDSDFEDPKVCASKPSHSPCVSKELSTHTNSSTKAAKCKENERCFNEEIINRLADIQSKQHQLASDQVELKLEMIALRRFVANTFADLMGEIKNRNTGNFPKPSDLQMVVYTGEVESERKIDGNKNVDRQTYV
ncbi:unnamed protein product [Fraxinus pennsylvanica]|uniref:Uncharacterized protein n=1 Tax=Fraxinus pennsylvanica TaxID=56036 RepID=A0AAD2DZR9_9LAMI|nr:unnamed protein product [Fraxinus pennsylvanica]